MRFGKKKLTLTSERDLAVVDKDGKRTVVDGQSADDRLALDGVRAFAKNASRKTS